MYVALRAHSPIFQLVMVLLPIFLMFLLSKSFETLYDDTAQMAK